MEVNVLTWIITCAVMLGLFVFDFYSHVKTPHEPTLKESALWSLFYIGLACVFGVFLWFTWSEPGNPHQHGLEFFAGYVTEKALSVDNLFVFAMILGSFQIPRKYQQKVLLIGIALALVLRGIFIGLGAAVISAWSDVFYIFGLFLLWTAAKLLVDEIRGVEEKSPEDMAVIKLIRRVIPVSTEVRSDKLIDKQKTATGVKRAVTPLLVALIAIGFIDVLFALDSIPAIYGITEEPYIVFTTNALALLGLRQLFFLLDGLLEKLVYLSYGLVAILGFIGLKLVLHALHDNNLSFIAGGNNVPVPEISVELSLMVIIGVLVLTSVLSLTVGKTNSNSQQTDGNSLKD